MTTDTATFVDALARYLDSAGLVRYQLVGAYAEGDIPATFFNLLPAKPEAALAITVYDELFDRDDHNPDVYVQLRWRLPGRDPRSVDRIADDANAILHDKTHLTFPGGVRVLLCRRKVRGLTTPDSNGRFERADSYVFTLNPGGTTS
ncbi:minor capsid protein [Nocardia acidivorans]|uniref:minor capsid protein n=1 Tax=Nocardia acidivorans TaxID=404580 RepID=UPI0008355892|nr:minor capsid protein [Nocardia acidivorans]